MSNNITATYSTGTNTTATINNTSTGPRNVSVTAPSVAKLTKLTAHYNLCSASSFGYCGYIYS